MTRLIFSLEQDNDEDEEEEAVPSSISSIMVVISRLLVRGSWRPRKLPQLLDPNLLLTYCYVGEITTWRHTEGLYSALPTLAFFVCKVVKARNNESAS